WRVTELIERQAIVDVVSEFARARVAARVSQYDLEERLPIDLLAEMADLGFFGGVVSTRLGGLGLDYVTFTEVIEAMSRTCQILGCLMSMPSGLVGASIGAFGTPEQQ